MSLEEKRIQCRKANVKDSCKYSRMSCQGHNAAISSLWDLFSNRFGYALDIFWICCTSKGKRFPSGLNQFTTHE